MQQNQNQINLGFFELIRFATTNDKILMWLGGLAALVNAMALPMFTVILGAIIDSFSPDQDTINLMTRNAMYLYQFIRQLFGIGAISMLLSVIMFSTWRITGSRQGAEYHKHYFKAILNFDIRDFDMIYTNEFNSKDALEKIPIMIFKFCTCIFSFQFGFLSGWRVVLVVSATLPVISVTITVIKILNQKSASECQVFLSEADANLEQSINNIETIKVLDGEKFECANYQRSLALALKQIQQYTVLIGIAMGFLFCAILWSYAMTCWYGVQLISEQTINSDKPYNAGDVITTLFAILAGGFYLRQAGLYLQDIVRGRVAALEVCQILDGVPRRLNSQNPQQLDCFKGSLEFRNVSFSYPKHPDQNILTNMNLIIPSGQKVALVGENGCGKSTIIQLIERFYDCQQGAIFFGKVNIKEIDLIDLRTRVGLIESNPVRFSASIKENLLYAKSNATSEELIEVLTKSNIWDFISQLENSLDTYVGVGGCQLTGAQKYRIAIARTILKKPQLLLIDEPTQKFDSTEHKSIQETLDEISKGITTLVISNRLTTISNCDYILVIDQGQVLEQGTHEVLMNMHGKYEKLVRDQFTTDLDGDHNKYLETQLTYLQNGQDKQLNQDLIADLEDVGQVPPQIEVPFLFNKMSDNHSSFEIEKLLPQQEQSKFRQLMRILNYNKEQRLYLIIGTIVAFINGSVFPVFAMYLSQMITVLIQSNPNLYDSDYLKLQIEIEVKDKADEIILKFCYCGLVSLFCWALQTTLFSFFARKVIMNLKQVTHRKLLRMPISFFDNVENSADTLIHKLSTNYKFLNCLISSMIGSNIQNLASLMISLSIAFYSSWQLTLIVLSLSPIVYFTGKFQTKSMSKYPANTNQESKDSNNLIIEAITNVKTLQSLGNQNMIPHLYKNKKLTVLQNWTQGIQDGLTFGFSTSSKYFINSIYFYLGALLVVHTGLSIQAMFTSFLVLIFAIIGLGRNSVLTDLQALKNTYENLFDIIDADDEFQVEERMNPQKVYSPIKGKIEFKNIKFRYCNSTKYIFNDLSILIQPGTRVTIIGPSGSGKSTIMKLLLRFYEPLSGQILVDDIDIRRYDIRHLRRSFASVSQKPFIFKGTIRENIIYNQEIVTEEGIREIQVKAQVKEFISTTNQGDEKQVNSRRGYKREYATGSQKQEVTVARAILRKLITEQQIIEATKNADAYDFITTNAFHQLINNHGQGFDLQVGPQGVQISQSEKQKITFARAFVRNAEVLLLDEAINDLDYQSQSIVLENLSHFANDKTSISISNRIFKTNENDLIYALVDGQLIEQRQLKSHSLEIAPFRLEENVRK